MSTRWKGIVAYDGTEFNGWQSQVGGNTIQDILEKRLEVILPERVRVHGSGRTDSGVHAKGQVFHFDAEWKHPDSHLLRAMRSGLPGSIQVKSLRGVPAGFHARFSAKGKRYRYRIYQGYADPMETRYCLSMGGRRLDVDAMRAAAPRLLGEHDFTAYSTSRNDGKKENPVKTITRMEIIDQGPRISFVTEGDGYLYKMVRRMAGALIDVGLGKLTPEDLTRILESRTRDTEVRTAPARGLCLEKVFY